MPETETTAPAPQTEPTPKPTEENTPDTEAEIERRVQERIEAQRKKDEAKAKREREEADRKRLEQQGQWEESARKADEARAAAEAKAEAAALELKRERMGTKLRDHLAANHADYVKSAPYIARMIDVDSGTTDETLAKRIKEASEQFVKDNPRAPANASAAPGTPPYNRVFGNNARRPSNVNRTPERSVVSTRF